MKKKLFVFIVTSLFINLFAVQITIAVESIEDQIQLLNSQIENFEKQNPDIDVEIYLIPSYPGSTYKFYGTFVVTNAKEPTILSLDMEWINEFSPFLVSLNQDAEYFDVNNLVPQTIEMVTINSEIKAIPYYVETGVLYYRKDLLEKYGYEVPKTWDELITIAKDISQKEGIEGLVWPGARYEELTTFFLEILYSNGGKIFEGDNFVLEQQENKEKALESLKILNNIISEEISPKGITTYREEECRNIFQSGEAVFMRNLSYAWHLLNSEGSAVNGKVGIAPIPKTEFTNQHVFVLEGKALAINPNASDEEREAAKKFIKYLISKENQIQRLTQLNFLPTDLEVFNEPTISEVDPNLLNFKYSLENLVLKPKSPIYTEISFPIQNNVYDVLTGRINVERALNNIISEIKFLLR
ncbi:ABC transporter substrate-binding protein [Petrotoga olearia]|uniref:ABC transporter substrate-binding protein n=2 Tax=Petrotoga olearia TaxID=156203 RepID=A0A2K1NWV9_9BACT|nr:ABC transporter substrate-binding protein [Petrotoga olearia]PNR95014.1 ABC transporter substrate-binding protein [Petrotoga olearia DSM 13574]RMA72958.1 ABC-type glycerol-3-phosphate transport system substrate-binding protein [Petrotoga olearia]